MTSPEGAALLSSGLCTSGTGVRVRYLRLVRERRVLVLWLAELVSVFGDRFFTLALTWTAWQRSGAMALGVVVIAESVPRILIGIFGRTLVARAASFRVLARIEAAQVVVIGSLPWLWDQIGLAGVVAVIAVIGAADAVSDPARASLLPDLVLPDQIRDVTGLMDATGRLTWVIGPGAAAVLLAVMEPGGLFLIDAATFAVSALALAWLTRHVRTSAAVGPGSDQAGTGEEPAPQAPRAWTVARAHPLVAAGIGLDTVGQALYCVTTIGLPVLLTTRLDEGPETYALVITCLGIGSLVGNLVTGNTRVPGRWVTVLCASWIARGMVLAAFAAVQSLPLLLLLTAGCSALVPLGDITLGARLAMLPGPQRLRAMTVYWAGLDVGCLVGMAVLPVLITATVTGAFIASGLLTAVAAAGLLVLAARAQNQRRAAAGLSRAGDVVRSPQGEALALQQQVPDPDALVVADRR
jgi:hypothetical protein